MRDDAAHEVAIDQLVLRLVDVDHARAQQIAHDVAAALHDRLRVAGITGQLHLARIHIRVTEDVTLDRLPGLIADRIWEAVS